MGDNIIEVVAEVVGAVAEGIKSGIEDAEIAEDLWDLFHEPRTAKRQRVAASRTPAPAPLPSLTPLEQVLMTVEQAKGRDQAEALLRRIEAKVANRRYENFVATLPVLAPASGHARHRAPHPSDNYAFEDEPLP